jgi:hypothetical protein
LIEATNQKKEADRFDCVEWFEKIIIGSGGMANLKSIFEQKDRKNGHLKVVKASKSGVGGGPRDGKNAAYKLPCRLYGKDDGLLVPWGTEADEKPAATTDEKGDSSVGELQLENPPNGKRKADSPQVGEQQQKKQKVAEGGSTAPTTDEKRDSSVGEQQQVNPTEGKRKADSLQVGEQQQKNQKVTEGGSNT